MLLARTAVVDVRVALFVVEHNPAYMGNQRNYQEDNQNLTGSGPGNLPVLTTSTLTPPACSEAVPENGLWVA